MMSTAWELTEEDAFAVLSAHELAASRTDSAVARAYEVIARESERIENAVLFYVDFDAQVEASQCEIEDVLMENGIITGRKKFLAP